MDNPSDPGCAVHPDGTLKDASEIEWQNDKDDDLRLSNGGLLEISRTSRNSME
jgi:hypothetical protein